jgi:hypothetical protein
LLARRRCGIWLQQSDGVTLRGLNVIESGGDGIMILGGSLARHDPVPSLNTHIIDCVFDRNYRQVWKETAFRIKILFNF